MRAVRGYSNHCSADPALYRHATLLADLATSDDLPPPTALFGATSRANGLVGGQPMGRSASMTAGTSKNAQVGLTLPHRLSSFPY